MGESERAEPAKQEEEEEECTPGHRTVRSGRKDSPLRENTEGFFFLIIYKHQQNKTEKQTKQKGNLVTHPRTHRIVLQSYNLNIYIRIDFYYVL